MLTLDPYPVISLRKEDVLAPEEMGSKRKGWVQVAGDSERWLFKYARLSNGQVTGEHWAEKVAAEVAGFLYSPCARGACHLEDLQAVSADGSLNSPSLAPN